MAALKASRDKSHRAAFDSPYSRAMSEGASVDVTAAAPG
jgi:hypothetical protein